MTPNSSSDVPTSAPTPVARFRESVVSEASAIWTVVRRSPEWAIIVFAWIAAGFIPAFWYIGEDHWWSQTTSPLFIQPFVPFFCAALFWQDRVKLAEAWQRTPRTKKRGSPWILWLGCTVLLVSHLIHVLTVAAVGMILIAAGIIYLAYGASVLKQSRRPLLFSLLMIPPPATLIAPATQITGGQVWKVITLALQKVGKSCSMTPGTVFTSFEMQGQVFQIPNFQATVVVFTAFILLFVAVWRRERVGNALVFIACGALLSVLLTVLVPFFALLLPVTSVTNALVLVHPVPLFVIATAIAVFVRGRMKAWGSNLAQSSRTLGKMGQAAQKATERATSGVASGMDGSVGRVGRGVNRGTEAAIDKFFAAIAKPFKRKRRDRW